ncbi:MAG: hypothetical protein WC337_05650 [Candidatus Muiribacteriota bacterium]
MFLKTWVIKVINRYKEKQAKIIINNQKNFGLYSSVLVKKNLIEKLAFFLQKKYFKDIDI